MLRNLLVFTLLSVSIGTVVYGQQTPDAKKSAEKKVNRGIFAFAPEGESYLGVQMQEISKENFTKYGLREAVGVGIEKVIENSPAAQAGFSSGDVIVKFNDESVESVRKLARLINEVAPDHQAKITVLRGGSEREINVTVGKRALPTFQNDNFDFNLKEMPALPNLPELRRVPLPPGQSGDNDKNVFIWRANGRQIGVGVAPLTEQLGSFFGVTGGRGLLINEVRENSPAAKAGLLAGDIIVETDGKEIKEISDLSRALNDKKEGTVNLTIIRSKNHQTITVTPEMSKDGTMKFEEFNKTLQRQSEFPDKNGAPQIAPFLQILNAPRVL